MKVPSVFRQNHRRRINPHRERAMLKRSSSIHTLVAFFAFLVPTFLWAQDQTISIKAHWDQVIRISKTTPSIFIGSGPAIWRGAAAHDPIFQSVHDFGGDDVRLSGGGYLYPHYGVAELEPPTATQTFWDFSKIDEVNEDALQALAGHRIVMNFTTIPEWMFKHAKPFHYPQDAEKLCWTCNPGTELRDPTYGEVADYFARVVSWNVKGGFTDELGKWHASGHHFKVDYWEVFNEPALEHGLSPEVYTGLYDAIVEAIHKVSPQTKFVGMSDNYAAAHPDFFMYFLNPRNHKPGVPLDMISYHFYAVPAPDETPEVNQFTYFAQADHFFETVGYVEAIRKHFSPRTGTMLNEVGTMLPADWDQDKPGYVYKPAPAVYWNLSAATFAYLYAGLAVRGIDVVNESGIPCGPDTWPSIAMHNWDTGQPNARFWVVKLIHDNFRPGDKIVDVENPSGAVLMQGYVTAGGERKVLIVNKRDHEIRLTLAGAQGGKLEVVDQHTASNPPSSSVIDGDNFELGGYAVAVVSLPKQ
jgi:hypothetical protein